MDLTKLFDLFVDFLLNPLVRDSVKYVASPESGFGATVAKWIFLMLPLLAIIWGFWISVVSLITLIVRAERVQYMRSLLVAWWDLGQAILIFWSGALKFVLRLIFAVALVLRFIVMTLGFLVRDLLMVPVYVASQVGDNVMNRGVPWIAVGLSLFWCVFEALLFTFVMTPLVLDTLSNMTGAGLSETAVRIPLFFFMLFIVLGSYSVLSTWTQSLATKNIPSIIKIGAIELVAMFVEVIFLYREFVDALVPWFAQHSAKGFELGVFGTIAIASMTWFGIRALSWFLFASAGTPVIMSIINGTGFKPSAPAAGVKADPSFIYMKNFMERLKADEIWLRGQIEEVVSAFILPPMQVLAGAVNFATILITGKTMFDLPFNNLAELKEARVLLHEVETT